jgi:hypothetical protein
MPGLLPVRSRRGDLQGRERPGDFATQLDAALHTPEELRVAVARFLADAGLAAGFVPLAAAFLDPFLGGDLAGLAGSFPGLPVGPLQLVHPGQLGRLLGVEVRQGRLLPPPLENFQVVADLLPADVQSLGNLVVRQAAEVQRGRLA